MELSERPAPETVVSPGPAAADPVIVPDCPTEVHPDQIRQDWPLEPEERALVVDWLATMSVRGAVYPDRRAVRPRHALRAMRTLTAFGRLALEQKQLDRLDQLEEGRRFCLTDHVTEAVNLGGQRMTAEAHRRGLSCAAELDKETQQAIGLAAEAEVAAAEAAAGWAAPAPPAPRPPRDPRLRQDWVIPALVQRAIMVRLVGMIQPGGAEFDVLSERERLMAADVLAQACRLALAQQRCDRAERYGEAPFDEEAALAEAEEAERQRLAERQRWRDEGVPGWGAPAGRPAGAPA